MCYFEQDVELQVGGPMNSVNINIHCALLMGRTIYPHIFVILFSLLNTVLVIKMHFCLL